MELMTTVDLLDAVKVLRNLRSDYALAKELGVMPQTISRYRVGGSTLDNEMCFRIAELLSFDVSQVIAWMEAERSAKAHRESDAARWAERAKRRAGMAAAALRAGGLGGGSRSAEAANGSNQAVSATDGLHIMRTRRRPRRPAPSSVAVSILALLSGAWHRHV